MKNKAKKKIAKIKANGIQSILTGKSGLFATLGIVTAFTLVRLLGNGKLSNVVSTLLGKISKTGESLKSNIAKPLQVG